MKLHVVTEDFMSENYRCLFHKIIFHILISRVFPFASGWFFPSCLDWSGNYSNEAEYTIQPLDRLDLKFPNQLNRVQSHDRLDLKFSGCRVST